MKPILKNSLALIALCWLTMNAAFAQAPAIQWQKTFGGTDEEHLYQAIQTSESGYLLSGTSNSIDGDVTIGFPDPAYWGIKTDNLRTPQWDLSLYTDEIDLVSAVRQTPDGGYIIATTGFVGSSTFTEDYYIVRVNSTGGVLWQKYYGGSGDDQANDIINTSDGGFIVAGASNSNDHDVTGNHGPSGHGAPQDYWVVKLDASGNIQWQKSLGGGNDDQPYSIMQTSDGGYIIGGYSQSSDGDITDHHGPAPINSTYDYWVVKIDAAGNKQWTKSLGGNADDYGYSINQTLEGGYIIAGYSYSNDGDVTDHHGTINTSDYWIVKLNATGNIAWKKSYGGTGDDRAQSIIQIPDGSYLVAGMTGSLSNSGDVTLNHGSGDGWILKLDVNGNIIWQKSLGGTANDAASSIIQTTDGGYLIGASTSSTNGDVTSNHGGSDYWLVKLTSECVPPSAPTSLSASGGTAKVCPGDVRTYTTPLVAGVTYHWTVPFGAVINSGQGTRTISVTYNSNFTANGEVAVTKVQGACESAPKKLTVVRNVPAIPSAINGLSAGVCGKTNQVYSVTNITGMTYQWTFPAGVTIVNGQGTNSVTVNFPSTNFTGNVSVNAVNACGSGNARSLAIRSVPAIPSSISGPASVCANQHNVVYSISAVANATSYQWAVPSGAVIISGQGTTSITVNYGTKNGSVKVRAVNACGASNYKNLAIVINCREGDDNETNINSAFEVNIFPNPTQDYFTLNIQSTDNSDYNLTLRNMLGQEVFSNLHIESNEPTTFGTALSPGIYIAEIIQGNNRREIKLVKNK